VGPIASLKSNEEEKHQGRKDEILKLSYIPHSLDQSMAILAFFVCISRVTPRS